MAPIVHGLEKIYGDRIVFVRVNIHQVENLPLMEQYGFSTTPEIYLVDGQGSVIASWHDFVSEDTLVQAFDAALAGASECG